MNREDNSAFATALSVLAVLGALIGFCLFFTVFLVVPFAIFVVGVIALIVTERQSNRKKAKAKAAPLPSDAPGVNS